MANEYCTWILYGVVIALFCMMLRDDGGVVEEAKPSEKRLLTAICRQNQ